MNARFWVWANGWVKLTLQPKQRLQWGEFHLTEEGYSSVHCEWHHHGDCVVWHSDCDGRDCDGRLSSSHEAQCSLSELAAQPSYDSMLQVPRWSIECQAQRDYTAERMGY